MEFIIGLRLLAIKERGMGPSVILQEDTPVEGETGEGLVGLLVAAK